MPIEFTKPATPTLSSEAVNVYKTDAVCAPPCTGRFVHDGYVKPLQTPLGNDAFGRKLYRHACDTCGAAVFFDRAYPLITYTNASISIEDQLRELMREREAITS